jgi:hypothetical protein
MVVKVRELIVTIVQYAKLNKVILVFRIPSDIDARLKKKTNAGFNAPEPEFFNIRTEKHKSNG